jgi:hypothetical protein
MLDVAKRDSMSNHAFTVSLLTTPAMNRVRFLLGACVLVLLAGCAAKSPPTVATFPAGCPAGWEFLYTSHAIVGQSERLGEMCRPMSDSARYTVAVQGSARP